MKQTTRETLPSSFAGKVSIDLDDYGSFVWNIIDDKKDIHTLSQELDAHFPKMEKSLSRLIKFLEILKDHHLITYSEKLK